MSASNKYFRELYERYRTNSADEVEFEQFLEFLRNPENLEVLKQDMSKDWKDFKGSEEPSPVLWHEIEREIRKQKAFERDLERQRKIRNYWWAAAASLLVMVGLTIGMYLWSAPDEYITYTTGYGQVEKIILDDGTQVTLNANSELKWKRSWKKDGDRLAVLRGEAFFDVTTIQDENHGEKTGFDVQTDDLTIQVVGTAFNVKSRTQKTDIFLKEGKILLDLKETVSDDYLQKNEELIAMAPGESVSYSATTKKLEKAESDQYGNASWMAGTFMYSNKSVRDILQSLQEIYGIQFEVEDPSILERKLTTNLPYSDWPIVESGLELILQAQIETRDAQTIIIKKE